MLTVETLREVETNRYEEPDGEFLELIAEKRNTLRVLTRREGKTPASSSYNTNEEGEPLCNGKDGGQCGRVVDEPGNACWQHS